MSTRDVATVPALDEEIVRALAWCRLGSSAGFGHPENDGFRRAEQLGLLAHHPVWHATAQGEGVLIALGMLGPTYVPERTMVSILWAREPREHALAQFVAAWPEGLEDCYPDSFAAEVEKAKAAWREWPGDGQAWVFWTSVEELARP